MYNFFRSGMSPPPSFHSSLGRPRFSFLLLVVFCESEVPVRLDGTRVCREGDIGEATGESFERLSLGTGTFGAGAVPLWREVDEMLFTGC